MLYSDNRVLNRVCQGKRKFSLMKEVRTSDQIFSCLAPIARYSWSCPLLFPELLHSNIRGEYETLRNAKYLVPIDGYDYYSLWLCQDFSELSVVNRDNHSGCLFLAIDNLFFPTGEPRGVSTPGNPIELL